MVHLVETPIWTLFALRFSRGTLEVIFFSLFSCCYFRQSRLKKKLVLWYFLLEHPVYFTVVSVLTSLTLLSLFPPFLWFSLTSFSLTLCDEVLYFPLPSPIASLLSHENQLLCWRPHASAGAWTLPSPLLSLQLTRTGSTGGDGWRIEKLSLKHTRTLRHTASLSLYTPDLWPHSPPRPNLDSCMSDHH